jgi:hypothetical protein
MERRSFRSTKGGLRMPIDAMSCGASSCDTNHRRLRRWGVWFIFNPVFIVCQYIFIVSCDSKGNPMRAPRSAVGFDGCLPRPPAGSTVLPLGAAVESTGGSQERSQSGGDCGRWRPETDCVRAQGRADLGRLTGQLSRSWCRLRWGFPKTQIPAANESLQGYLLCRRGTSSTRLTRSRTLFVVLFPATTRLLLAEVLSSAVCERR